MLCGLKSAPSVALNAPAISISVRASNFSNVSASPTLVSALLTATSSVVLWSPEMLSVNAYLQCRPLEVTIIHQLA